MPQYEKHESLERVTPQISTLSYAVAKVHSWVTANYGSPESADYSLIDYPDWDELSLNFIEALCCKPAEQWNKRESAVFNEAVLMDWQWHLLLKNMSLSNLLPIVLASYPVRTVTMYLLVETRRINDVATLQRVALHHFETNPDTNIRLEAFQMLARTKWNQTEKHAQLYWNSADLTAQITALQALAAYESDHLPQYLDLAESTQDPTLTRIASATRTIEALKKAESQSVEKSSGGS